MDRKENLLFLDYALTFRRARLTFDDLQNAPTSDSLKKKLSQAPKGLTSLYATITKRFSETLDEDQLLLCRRVLQWIITTKEQLTVNQLAVALAVRDGQKFFDETDMMIDPREEILTVCAPLVEILDDDIVRIIHLSVKDFLLDSSRTDGQNDFIFSTDTLSANIGITLLTLLSFDAFSASIFSASTSSWGSNDQIKGGNPSVAAGPSSSVSDEADDQSDDEKNSSQASVMLQYGLDNWHHHCVESEAVEYAHRLHPFVCDYLKSDSCFLWMETLGCQDSANWIHYESRLVEWGRKLVVGQETALSKGFIHQIAHRRFERLNRHFDLSHPETLKAMNALATSWWEQGHWKEAEKLELQEIEIRKKVLGPEHQDTMKCIDGLAATYLDQGRYNEAEELLMQILPIQTKILGLEHPETLFSTARLASTYFNQGRWKEAEELDIQVMEMRKRVLGQEHPDTLWSMGNLALTYSKQGCWKEAEELGIQVIETRKRVLGQEHPDTLSSMGNLASMYSSQGRWKEAEELEIQVMETRKRVLGEGHPNTLSSMNNLAHTWKSLGQDKDAIALMRQAVMGRREVLGSEHHYTVGSRENLEEWETALNFQEAGFSAETFRLGMEDEDSEVSEGDTSDEEPEGDAPDEVPISPTTSRPSSPSEHQEGSIQSVHLRALSPDGPA